jgi:SAM-dependent methyltransferase
MTGLVERQRDHFNRIASRYRAARQGGNHRTLKRIMWSAFLRDKPELMKPGLRVLDAMCGYADAYDILREHLSVSIDYTGFDYSDEVVARVAAERPQLRVSKADATRYEPDRAYDLVVLIGGLHHVHHAAAPTLARLTAAVAPGGYFLSLEPTHGNPLSAALRRSIYRRNRLFDAETEQGFDCGELLEMFSAAGLTAEDIMYPGLLSYVLYYNPDAFPWLNVGGERAVRAIFAAEQPWMRSRLAGALSFATLSLWRKPE